MGKTGNKFDSLKMYKDEKSIRSLEDDFISRIVCQ